MIDKTLTAEPDFGPFVTFAKALAQPDSELEVLAKRARDATADYGKIAGLGSGKIGALAAAWVESNALYLKRVAIVARREQQRLDSERMAIARSHPASVSRRDAYRAIDSGNAQDAETCFKAAGQLAKAVRPHHEAIAAASQVIELCYARSLRYGAGLKADMSFYPLLSTAMAEASAKAQRELQAKL